MSSYGAAAGTQSTAWGHGRYCRNGRAQSQTEARAIGEVTAQII